MWDVTLIWVTPVAQDLPKILLTENLKSLVGALTKKINLI